MLTVWTGILLYRKSTVSAETDQKRRNAAVTVVLLGVVFLLTNVSGVVVCGTILNEEGKTPTDGSYQIWLILMVLNAALNPLVILRRKLVGATHCWGLVTTTLSRASVDTI